MNTIFKIIWNHATQSFVVASELAKGHTKSSTRTSRRVFNLTRIGAALSLALGSSAVMAATQATGTGTTCVVNGISVACANGAQAITEGSIAIGENAAAGNENLTNNFAEVINPKTKQPFASAEEMDSYISTAPASDNVKRTWIGKRNNIAIGAGATAMGGRNISIGENAAMGTVDAWNIQNVNIGTEAGARSKKDYSVAIGYQAGALSEKKQQEQLNSPALGTNNLGQPNDGGRLPSIFIGKNAGYDTVAYGNIGMGRNAAAQMKDPYGTNNVFIGADAGIRSGSGIVDGTNFRQLSWGGKEYLRPDGSLNNPAASLMVGFNVGIGPNAQWDTQGSSNSSLGWKALQNSLGSGNTAMGNISGSFVHGDLNTAMGNYAGSHQTASRTVALGNGARTTGNGNVALGSDSWAGSKEEARVLTGNGKDTNGFASTKMNDTALGFRTEALGGSSLAAGERAKATEDAAIAIGSNAEARGVGAIALGAATGLEYTSAADQYGDSTVNPDSVKEETKQAIATGEHSIAVGTAAESIGDRSTAIGKQSSAQAQDSIAQGTEAKAYGESTVAIGKNAKATLANNVSLGSGSVDRQAVQINDATVEGVSYSGFAGKAKAVVSVGVKNAERQIINVAPGEISKTSTDAINGSQLYLVSEGLTNQMPVVYTDKDGNKVYKTPEGKFVKADGTEVPAGDVIASMNNPDGSTTKPTTLTNIAGNLPGAKKDTKAPTTENTTTAGTAPTADEVKKMQNNAATVGDVLNAGWNLQNNGKARDFVKPYDTVNFVNGANTIAVVDTAADLLSSAIRINVTGLPIAYTDDQGNPLVKVGDEFYNKDDVENGAPKKDAKPVEPTGTTLVNKDGEVNKDGKADPQTLDNVKSAVNDQAPKDEKGEPIKDPSYADKLAEAVKNKPNAAVNVSDLKNVSDNIKNANNGGGFGLKDDNKDVINQDLGKQIQIKGKEGSGVTSTVVSEKDDDGEITDQYLQIGLDKDVTIGDDKNPGTITVKGEPGKKGEDGKPGEPGKNGIAIDGKDGGTIVVGGSDGKDGAIGKAGKDGEDGKPGVALKGKDGAIGLTGPAGKDGKSPKADISLAFGKPGLDGNDGPAGKDGKDTKPRLEVNGEEVATLNDGLKFEGNQGGTIAKKLNETVAVKGKLANDADATAANTRVDVENGELIIKMAKMLKDLEGAEFKDKDGNTVVVKDGGIVLKGKDATDDSADNPKNVSLTQNGLNNGGNKITNVGRGTDKTDAVNVEQLEEVKTSAGAGGFNVATNGEDAKKISNGDTVDFVNGNNTVVSKVDTPKGTKVKVDLAKDLKGLNSVELKDQVGNVTNVTGNGVNITGTNAAGKPSNVSLTANGLDNGGNRITNVAPGVKGTDAVNVNQLNAVGNRIGDVDRKARGGIAGSTAMANLPQAYIPGHSMVAVAAGTHRGANAVAVGVSRISDSGHVIIKLSGSTDSKGGTNAGVGVGYQW